MSNKRHSHRRAYSDGQRVSFLRRHLAGVIVTLVVLAIGLGSFTWSGFSADSNADSHTNLHIPQRVISLAPSVTELIYVLGVDSTLVADTRYCKFPAAADTLPEVGGFLDPNLELIVSLGPDLVILLQEHDDLQNKLSKLNIPILTVDHQTVKGILASYTQLGSRLGAEASADSLLADHSQRIAAIEKLTSELSRPKTLVSIGHSDKPETINSVYAAGNEGFYSELVRLAGGENVVETDKIRYPVLGPESIRALSPEIILDLFPGAETGASVDVHFVQKQWRSLSDIPAVRNNRIVVLRGGFFVIPGPRFLEILERFVSAIHPEVNEALSTP